MMLFRPHRHRRTLKWFFVIVLVTMVSSLTGLGVNNLVIRSVECRDDESQACASEIVAELARSVGQRILLLQLKDMERKIKQSDPAVKSVLLRIELTSRKLVATITRRRPVVRVAAFSSFDRSLVIDDEGIVFPPVATEEALPVMVWDGFSTLRPGQKVPDQLARAATLVHLLPATIGIVPTVSVRGNALDVTTIEGTLVTFSLAQDPAQQLVALQLIINQSRIDQVVYRSIDVRYEHPIVTD